MRVHLYSTRVGLNVCAKAEVAAKISALLCPHAGPPPLQSTTPSGFVIGLASVSIEAMPNEKSIRLQRGVIDVRRLPARGWIPRLVGSESHCGDSPNHN